MAQNNKILGGDDEKAAKPNGCHNCRFAIVIGTAGPQLIGEVVRECHRYPPSFMLVPAANGMTPAFGFPQVQARTFCFSFETMPSLIQ